MTGRRTAVELFKVLWPAVAAFVVVLWAFRAVGSTFLESYTLDLGSISFPTPRYLYFVFYCAVLGSLATVLLIVAVTRYLSFKAQLSPAEAVGDSIGTDRSWLILSMAATFVVTVLIRALILRDGPLTDDESSYRFAAQLLARGRLWVASYPQREFFDRAFMINDGRFYSEYFIGWPLLMVPGVYVGLTGYMNAVYATLTVPALFLTTRRLAGAEAARVVTILFLAAPMLMIGAATEISHPSCLMALAWATYFTVRTRESAAPWWCHSGLAFFCGVAFLIRPTAALGVASPLVVAWLLALRIVWWPRRLRALLAFVVPATLLAAVFFGVNAAQNGSPFITSYDRMLAFAQEVGHRNLGSPGSRPLSVGDYLLPHGRLGEALGYTTVALVRLLFDLFGTPWFLVLVGLAWGAKSAPMIWASASCFVAVHFFLTDSGVDTFGPVHFFELALPILLLCGIGFRRLTSVTHELKPAWPRSWPLAAVACMVVVALIGYVPVRVQAVSAVADAVNRPLEIVERTRIHNAVVFSSRWTAHPTCADMPRNFVFFRPNNDPGLQNDVLWVNHLGVDRDRALLRSFPGRTGYLLHWEGCKARLVQFD